ncbi:MAG: MFS transporter, partial [Verrucomicrobiota bacterium]
MTGGRRLGVLVTAALALVFDGVELGLMPVASLSVSKSLLGASYTPTLGGDWFARFTAALMLGAAVGGIVLGNLGDRIGRTRALGVSVLAYSVFAGLGAWVRSQEEMLALRFLVGLGVGGVWPNAVALAAECWPDKSRPLVAGLMGAALNAGILGLSQVARLWPVTPDSWRWLFHLAAVPAGLGLLALWIVPESPLWLAQHAKGSTADPDSTVDPDSTPAPASNPVRELLRPPLLRTTLVGILLGSIPMIGAWAASKWMIPWADAVAGATTPGYKASTQGAWAFGAVLGSFVGAQVAVLLGRRRAYAAISLGAAALTVGLFRGTAPLRPEFLPLVFAQGFVGTLFFGWLPLYLPELFP